jgi:hypothetical protein
LSLAGGADRDAGATTQAYAYAKSARYEATFVPSADALIEFNSASRASSSAIDINLIAMLVSIIGDPSRCGQ